MTRPCLCFHGFTGGPYELMPLAGHLEAAGWSCVLPTLPGHESPRRIRFVRWERWVEAADDAARRIADAYGAFDLVGFSMGGLLAAHVANRYPVRRLVLLNAAAIYLSPGRFALDVAEALHNRDWGRFALRKRVPLKATLQFMKLARYANSLWGGIRVPTLIAQSGRDPVVHPYSARLLAARIPAPKQVIELPRSKHLICLDREADVLFEAVKRFLSGAVPAAQRPLYDA